MLVNCFHGLLILSHAQGGQLTGHLHPMAGTCKSLLLETVRHFGIRVVVEKVTWANLKEFYFSLVAGMLAYLCDQYTSKYRSFFSCPKLTPIFPSALDTGRLVKLSNNSCILLLLD